ncbi:hypothetical protein BY458DRAFT_125361 [Sporodiniella umbellata]|nr:hypothetical protein BY458DRAFT_125361 [Sporodiniella umbellata]
MFFFQNNQYWEKNDWYRKHGYSLPLDTYFLIQWTSLLLLDFAFFGFLTRFITNNSAQATLEETYTHWVPESIWETWNSRLMLLLSLLVKILSVITSCIDTEDIVVKEQQVSRSQTFVKQFGIPVIDGRTNICGICRVKVPKSTRHCKLCNKCVDTMDHHCKWLNCCIGKKNYSTTPI